MSEQNVFEINLLNKNWKNMFIYKKLIIIDKVKHFQAVNNKLMLKLVRWRLGNIY